MKTDNHETLLKENAELKHLIQQFKNLLDSIPDPVFMKDENLRWIYGNPVILNLYNIDKDNYIGKTEDQLLPEEFAESCMESDRQAVAKRTISKSEECARDPEGELHYYEVFKVPSYDKESGLFSGLIGVGRDVTKRKEVQGALEEENKKRKKHEKELSNLTETLEQQVKNRTQDLEASKDELKLLASIDPMTKLYNRRYFAEVSEELFDSNKRKHSNVSLILLDIDNFKSVNDIYGHHIGDDVIISIANILMENTRKNDIVCRYGGEEYIILLPETELVVSMKLAEKVRELVENLVIKLPKEKELRVSISIGVSMANMIVDNNIEIAINKADNAMYEAKRSGKNKVVSYSEQYQDKKR